MRISPTSTKIGHWINNPELIFLYILIPFSFFVWRCVCLSGGACACLWGACTWACWRTHPCGGQSRMWGIPLPFSALLPWNISHSLLTSSWGPPVPVPPVLRLQAYAVSHAWLFYVESCGFKPAEKVLFPSEPPPALTDSSIRRHLYVPKHDH